MKSRCLLFGRWTKVVHAYKKNVLHTEWVCKTSFVLSLWMLGELLNIKISKQNRRHSNCKDEKVSKSDIYRTRLKKKLVKTCDYTKSHRHVFVKKAKKLNTYTVYKSFCDISRTTQNLQLHNNTIYSKLHVFAFESLTFSHPSKRIEITADICHDFPLIFCIDQTSDWRTMTAQWFIAEKSALWQFDNIIKSTF